MPSQAPRANVLGELTAEADEAMLKSAFYESSNYRALVSATDFRFVVGRRGTGKSALFQKVAHVLHKHRAKHILLMTERPAEELVSAFNFEITKLTNDYLETRKITKLTWKVQILCDAIDTILAYYKVDRVTREKDLRSYQGKHTAIFSKKGVGRALAALREAIHFNTSGSAATLPEALADRFDIANTEKLVSEALSDIDRKMMFLYDGLDEGWMANHVATGFLGGLAKVASEFREADGIHCLLFVRDNMFRALAEFDGDYSRNIEGNTLRLHWDEVALLDFVTLRLRAAFQWTDEQNIRVWDRFAKRGLSGMDGFRKCLQLTLYRPRDVIALLNGAYQVARQSKRDEIIDPDVESTATKISQTRLDDLFKEYEHVFPGLPLFVQSFRTAVPRLRYQQVLDLLDKTVSSSHAGAAARDFALLRTASEAFAALYSVGFIGVQNSDHSVRFCHDGSNTDVESLAPATTTVVHPCYWRALDLKHEEHQEIVLRVDDEDDEATSHLAKAEVSQMRVRKLGTVIAELGTIKEGQQDANKFEKWVFDAVRYLFARRLDNISWKPNPGLVQQRDIVGTLKEAGGFWNRLSRYDVSQLIIEAKNFQEMAASEFRQAWSYMSGPYGRCLMMVTRSEQDSLSEHERALVKEGYDTQHKLVILVPALLLHRSLRKMQGPNEERDRDDYLDKKLAKRMDQFEREFIAAKTPRVSRA